ncbi:hypothetical protein [Streptomyces sp. NPDC060131]|uniref:hypothetical protein n=1 Tax=Streptomyces sp. NPDC060131 TaxID=3347058 RepID=UPI0036546D8F
MSPHSVRIPGFALALPGVEEMPPQVRRLALVLSFATRIEPELIRAARIRVRPDLHVGTESALWFGSWSHRSSAEYMVMRPSLLEPLRELLCAELQASSEGDAVRQAGEIVFRLHHGLSPVLALEERVTWAAVLADAGLDTAEAGSDPQADVDRLLESALRAAVEAPERREGLRRWFTGAWQRFPERVRQAPAAQGLFDVLDVAGRSVRSPGRSAVRSRVGDVALPVRHDGAYITVGAPGWPGESILVPDTQPRVLEVTGDLADWGEAEKIRVPRSACWEDTSAICGTRMPSVSGSRLSSSPVRAPLLPTTGIPSTSCALILCPILRTRRTRGWTRRYAGPLPRASS